jgi:hypothetical protein
MSCLLKRNASFYSETLIPFRRRKMEIENAYNTNPVIPRVGIENGSTSADRKLNVSGILPVTKDKNGKWLVLFAQLMITSLSVISGLDIEFLIGFQGFTEQERKNLIGMMAKSFGEGFKCKSFLHSYPEPVSMCKIREDIANLNTNADIYMVMDDDFIFKGNAKRRYEEIIEYMRVNPKCGAVMASSFFGGHRTFEKIYRPKSSNWWTNRGLFLRNLKDKSWRFTPEDSHAITGGLEESYSVLSRMAEGYYGAKTFYVDTHHEAARVDEGFLASSIKKGRYDPDLDIHNPKYGGILKLIRSKWDDPTWTFKSKRTPKAIRGRF